MKVIKSKQFLENLAKQKNTFVRYTVFKIQKNY